MANKQQVQIDLLFQAKTDQALQNLNQLGTLLDKITKNTTIGIDSGPMQTAVDSAKMLQTHLQEAMNVKTGKIDLTKLNSSLKSAGTSLGQLSQNLLAIPHTGQKAFLSLAKAIANAEPPAIRLGKKFQDMLTTLGNTAKWKVAQGAINGISGAMSDAVKYAKDMNKALNDIRIVTQKSTGEMANFAKDAQLAARELSTTSTEYAKAALIFYQQGLDGDEVLKRADTVVKLANVTKQTAQSVSDQMTAIWNNFAEGSTNLEYYADVLTKLGAETAASTDEISQGLEKFAAVAKTIDLSYETATASVATIIDKTKQSAEVVGTSLKTIFARMEGLSLGETLEDGVDLNKYSQALKSVGVEILDVNGDIKSMDDILAATGEKWKMLGDSQKIALAQTVGGMRQYNQFMALMENWEDVQLNVDIAKNSTGELQEQQKIWSESWEAASNRVSEKLNQVYDKFINDETIIKLIDTLGYLVDTIGGVVDAFGGIGPMLLSISGIFSKQLMPIMSNGLNKIKEGWSVLTGSAAKEIAQTQATMQQQLQAMSTNSNMTATQQTEAAMTNTLIGLKRQLALQYKTMSQVQREEIERRIANIEKTEAETRAILDEVDAIEKRKRAAKQELSETLGPQGRQRLKEQGQEYLDEKEEPARKEARKQVAELRKNAGIEGSHHNTVAAEFRDPKKIVNKVNEAKQEVTRTTTDLDKSQEAWQNMEATSKAHKISLDLYDKGKFDAASMSSADAEWGKQIQEELQKVGVESIEALEELIATQEEAKAKAEERLRIEEQIQDIISQTNQSSQEAAKKTWDKQVFADTKITDQREDILSASPILVSDDYAGATAAAASVLQSKTTNEAGEPLQNSLAGSFSTTENQSKEVSELTIETSIENYNQLRTIIGEVEADGDMLAQSIQELGKILKNYEQASTKKKNPKASKKDKKEAEKEQKRAIEQANNLTKALQGPQKAYLKNANSAKKLEKVLNGLNGSEEEAADAMKTLQGITKEAQTTNQQAHSVFLGTAESMVSQAEAAGINTTTMQAVGDEYQAAATENAKLTNGLQLFQQQSDSVNNSLQNTPTAFQNVATGMMQAIGAVQGLYAGFNQLFTILNDDEATGMEKFMGSLTAIMAIIPSLITIYSGFGKAITFVKEKIQDKTKATQEDTEEELENTGATIAGSVADGISAGASKRDEEQTEEHTEAVKKDTQAETANVVVKTMKAAVEKFGIAGVAIGAVLGATAIAAIGATVAMAQNNAEQEKSIKIAEEQSKTGAEQTQQINEVSEALMEETNVLDGVIAAHKRLQEAGENTIETEKSIIEQAQKTSEAYQGVIDTLKQINEERAKLAQDDKATGGEPIDTDELEELQRELDRAIERKDTDKIIELQKTMSSKFGKVGYEANKEQAESVFGKIQSKAGTTSKTELGFEGVEGWSSNEEQTAAAIFTQHVSDARTNASGSDAADDVYVNMDYGDSDQFVAKFEQLIAARDAMKKEMTDSQLEDSGIYEDLTAYINTYKSDYEELQKYLNEMSKYGFIDVKNKMSTDLTDISSLSEYNEWMKEYEQQVRARAKEEGQDADEAWKEAQAYIESQQAVSDYVAVAKRIDAMEGKNDWAAWYDGLTDEQKKVFMDVDINKFQSEQAIENEMERLQKVADQKEIQVKITTYSSALELLNKEDWAGLANLENMNWGKDGIIDFSNFLNMSREEQQHYLTNENLKHLQELALSEQQELDIMQNNTQDYTEDDFIQAEKDAVIATRNYENSLVSTAIDTQDWTLLAESLEQVGENSTRGREAYEQFLDATSQDLGIDAKEVKDLAKQLPYLANNFDILSDAVKTDTVLQGQLALRIKQTEKGLEDFANAEEDIAEGLNSNNLLEYSQAMTTLKNSILEVLGVSDEFEAAGITLGAKFEQWAQNNYNTIKLALTGDDKAMDELWTQVIQDTYHQITGATGEAIVAMNTALSAFRMGVNIGTIQVGDQLTEDYTTGIKQNLTYMIQQCGASSEQVKAYLASIGITANKVITNLEDLNDIVLTYQGIDFTSITGGFDKILDKEKKYVDLVKKSDLVERYKEINDQLDDLADAMDEASKAADRLYGADRINKMKEVNALLKNEIELNKQKRAEAETHKENDKSNLQKAIGEFGLEFEFDEAGNITNYDEIMSAVWEYQNSEIEKANKGGVNEKEQKHLDDIQEKVDAVTEGISTYEDSRELIEDLDKEIQDDFYTWQDNNAEMLSYKLEVGLELNEMDMRNTEYQINKLGDDMFSAAEVGALKSSQKDIHLDNLEKYKAQKQALEDAYNAGEISEAAFAEGLKQIQDGMYGELEALQALDDEMMNYYGDTIAKAQDEVDKYTEKIEHSASVLDHYSSLLELVGKGKDYKTMGTVLKGAASVAKNQADVSKAEYEMYKKEAEEKKRLWDEALASGDAAAAELYEKEYEAAITAQNEAQEEMLSNTEAWLEAEKAVIENELNQLAQDLENSLTNGMSFDFVTMQMEHASSLQEEYLTNTNKIYETNKLIAQTQKQIDETTNSVAKRRLKEFADETKHLQNKSKLSNYELQVQQAKYDLLLAEIALEEAQQAKSTVRLQRDSEGNFGYVYTADQNQINDAIATQQEKENALYNLGLENANAYYEKYLQTMQEGTNALTELHLAYLNGEFESEEEFQTQKEALVAYYNQKLIDYAEIYGLAIGTHSQVGQDAWAAAFVDDPDSMVNKALDWKTKVDGYCLNAAGSLQKWYDKIIELEGYTNLNNLATEVETIKTNSENLATSITTAETGLIATLQKEFDQVDETTDGWADFRKELMGENKDGTGGIYKDFETLIDQISGENGLLKQLADLDATDTTITITTEYKTVGNPEGDNPKVTPTGDGTDGDDDPPIVPEDPGPTMTYHDPSKKLEAGTKIQLASDGSIHTISSSWGGGPKGYGYTTDQGLEINPQTLFSVKEMAPEKETQEESWTPTYGVNDMILYNGKAGQITEINEDSKTYKVHFNGAGGKDVFKNLAEDDFGLMGTVEDYTGMKIGQYYRVWGGAVNADPNCVYIAKLTDATWDESNFSYKLYFKTDPYGAHSDGMQGSTWANSTDVTPSYQKVGPKFGLEQDVEVAQETGIVTFDSSGKASQPGLAKVGDKGEIFDSKMLGDTRIYRVEWEKLQSAPEKYKKSWIGEDFLKGPHYAWSAFDTGGYTGEWGPDGKFALLHEKELILNPDDTSNFLSALGILDNILLTLDKYSVNAQLSGLLSSPAFSMNTQEALEQNVHIEASFPGVQDRNEIEEAFNTLINEAYQYANRK